MTPTNRIIFNTIILYAKIIICMAITLWAVPIILRALGVEDYGLYNLLAGVIALLSFLNASMTISTQRFLSVARGEKDEDQYNRVYNVSILIHLIIGIIVIIIFEALAPFLFKGFLNIDPTKIDIASTIYQILVINMFFTILTVPFNAVLNAYEDMLPFSIISIIEALLKLGIAYLLLHLTHNQLLVYSLGMMGITIFTLLITIAYVLIRYTRLHFRPFQTFDSSLFRQMLGFCGWNTFGSFAIACRNQGVAIVLNLFYGTVVNAAYGIANQINGVLNYFSSTIQKSINPQLMMSEGENDIARRTTLSYDLSKFSTIILGVVAIPLIVEMPKVLEIWLGDYPEYTLLFSRLILVVSLIYQLSSGLMSAIQSTGHIKTYQIVISCVILLNIPLSYYWLYIGDNAAVAFYVLIVIEVISLVVRIVFAQRIARIPIKDFVHAVLLPVSAILSATYIVLTGFTYIMEGSFVRIVITSCIGVILVGLGAWIWVLNQTERDWIIQKIKTHGKQ